MKKKLTFAALLKTAMQTLLFVLFILFIIVFAVQIFYFGFVFSRFSFYKQKQLTFKQEPVSVIVCAKNELENLRVFLPKIINQNYNNFELVLIDDASSDDSLELMEEYENQYPFIKLVKVENNEAFWGNKKFALTLGIKAAKHDNLLFIDADCYPASENWLASMTAQFSDKKQLILGYGGYQKIKGSFLNKLIRFETVLTAIQYFSWAQLGKPYMGVGRNLAYKKSLFFSVRGFMDHMKLRSGDDDLFVNQAGNTDNVGLNFIPEAFTYSVPKTTYKSYILQKRRHISTAKHYKFSDKLQLTLFFISQVFFITLAIILLSFLYQWIAVVAIIGSRYLLNWLIVGYAANKLKEKELVIFYPVLEILLLFIQLRVGLTNLFFKPKHWK